MQEHCEQKEWKWNGEPADRLDRPLFLFFCSFFHDVTDFVSTAPPAWRHSARPPTRPASGVQRCSMRTRSAKRCRGQTGGGGATAGGAPGEAGGDGGEHLAAAPGGDAHDLVGPGRCCPPRKTMQSISINGGAKYAVLRGGQWAWQISLAASIGCHFRTRTLTIN